MPVVRRADIENLEIPVPPLPVQRAIIELDNLMREEQSLLQKLARKKHELISTVCMAAAERKS
jgi:restriction endonuclease S subunit